MAEPAASVRAWQTSTPSSTRGRSAGGRRWTARTRSRSCSSLAARAATTCASTLRGGSARRACCGRRWPRPRPASMVTGARRPLRRPQPRGHHDPLRARLRQLQGPVRRTIEAILRTTGLGLSLGAHGISRQASSSSRARDPLPAIHALLDLPMRVAEQRADRGSSSRSTSSRTCSRWRTSTAPAQPHPAPGRGGVLRLLRLGAGDDARAVRHEGPSAVRPGRAAAARAPRRRGRGDATSSERFARTKRSAGDVLERAARDRARASSAGDAARPPALGGGRPPGATADEEAWQARARADAEPGRRGVRRALARASRRTSSARCGRSRSSPARRTVRGRSAPSA